MFNGAVLLIGDAGAGRSLAWADVAGTQITIGDTTGRILLADLADPGAPAVPLLDGLDRVWAVALARPDTVIAGVGETVSVQPANAISPVKASATTSSQPCSANSGPATRTSRT